jgi:hypothetical protein
MSSPDCNVAISSRPIPVAQASRRQRRDPTWDVRHDGYRQVLLRLDDLDAHYAINFGRALVPSSKCQCADCWRATGSAQSLASMPAKRKFGSQSLLAVLPYVALVAFVASAAVHPGVASANDEEEAGAQPTNERKAGPAAGSSEAVGPPSRQCRARPSVVPSLCGLIVLGGPDSL